VIRLRPEARKLWFSNVRSRISPWRWKNTARRSELLASPLFSPAWLRWRKSGSDSHCNVNSVRSIRPSAQGARQSIAGPGRGKLAQDHRRQDRASLDRGLETHEFGPLADDRSRVEHPANQRLQQRIRSRLLNRAELAVLQVLDPRREQKPEQTAEAEHVIGRAGGVSIMLADAQIGLVHVMQQAVEDIWCLAHRRRDHLCVERAVASGDVRIEHEPQVDAVFGIVSLSS
jgi:hypothetical protein